MTVLRYVAYGDSITHGFCGADDSYPEQIAELNEWEPINLGIQGLPASFGAQWRHGEAIAQLHPDLVTIMIGVNDCFSHPDDGRPGPSVGTNVGEIVDGIRAAEPEVPIAVVTPIRPVLLYSHWRAGIEELREQIQSAVERRVSNGDGHLMAVEGQSFVPAEHMFEGIHPTTQGYKDLAHNLNAELGFSRVVFQLASCSPLSLWLSGLTPGGRFIVYFSKRLLSSVDRFGTVATECDGRGIMLAPDDKTEGKADAAGSAAHMVHSAGTCEGATWQVLDVQSCIGSRLGHGHKTNGTRNTIAAMMTSSPPPLPQPPPRSPSLPSPPPPLMLPPPLHAAASLLVHPPSFCPRETDRAQPSLRLPLNRLPLIPLSTAVPPSQPSLALVASMPLVLVAIASGILLGSMCLCALRPCICNRFCRYRPIPRSQHAQRAPDLEALGNVAEVSAQQLSLCVHWVDESASVMHEEELDFCCRKVRSSRGLMQVVATALLPLYGKTAIRSGYQLLFHDGADLVRLTPQVPLELALRSLPLHVIFNDDQHAVRLCELALARSATRTPARKGDTRKGSRSLAMASRGRQRAT